MAKLEGVKTLDMVNGEITKVAYGGAEYERVEGDAQEGDLVLITDGSWCDATKGEFYLSVGISAKDPRIVDDIDEVDSNYDESYALFRKVSSSQPSLEDRVSTNEKDIAALKSDVAALKGEAKTEYVRIAKSEAKAGDFVKFDEAPNSYLTAGKYYEICRVDDYGDPHIVADDGDRFDMYYADDFEVYRKVSAASVEAEPKPERLKVGDYAKVVNATQSCMSGFSNGEIVEIIENPYGEDDCDFRVKSIAGNRYGYTKKTSDYIISAADEEVAEAKDAAARAKFKNGDKVRLKSGGGETPLYGFENGKVYTVVDNDYPQSRTEKKIQIECDWYHGYATPDQLEILTEEDAAEIEKWAAIGRKVGEYRVGDIVQYLYDGEICEVVAVTEDGCVKVATQDHGNCTENQSSIELIAPVEARFDQKDDE
ncbi:hypothetical protein [Bacillus sp. FSL K6-1284]|uniref:hypothetical protein n=1 Tax=Bacillus sp. FSL K6-1284 TaxID=2921468 RepID=UPI0030F958E0